MPLTMCAQLKALGYSAYAYHNHDYGYYDRDSLIPIWGMCTRRWETAWNYRVLAGIGFGNDRCDHRGVYE